MIYPGAYDHTSADSGDGASGSRDYSQSCEWGTLREEKCI